MDSLKDKLLKLKETLEKGMKNGGIGGPGAVKSGAVLPSLPKASKPGSTNSATPSVGKAPEGKKNPIKQAEQTQNKDIKDIKMKEAQAALSMKKKEEIAPEGSKNRETYEKEFLKYDTNGQWSLDKSDEEAAKKLKQVMGSKLRDKGSATRDERKAKIKSIMGDEHKSRSSKGPKTTFKDKAPSDKPKVLRRKAGEKKGLTSKDRKDKETRAKVETKLKDPEYKRKALVHNAKERQAVKDKETTYDNAVKEHDPDQRPAVAQKKRGQAFITQFNRRKNAPDKKLIDKENRGELKVKKTAREEMIEFLEKAKDDSIAFRANLPKTAEGKDRSAGAQYIKDAKAHAERKDAIRAKRALKEAKDAKGLTRMADKEEEESIEPKGSKMASKTTIGKIKPKKVEHDEVTRTERKAASDEEVVKFDTNGQWSLNKSGYKGYTEADNAKRKANNLSEGTGIHTMDRIKQYGGSGPDAASKEAKKAFKMSAKNPTHIKNADGKVTDVVHSSGRKKGKSVFESEEHKTQHLAELNKV